MVILSQYSRVNESMCAGGLFLTICHATEKILLLKFVKVSQKLAKKNLAKENAPKFFCSSF